MIEWARKHLRSCALSVRLARKIETLALVVANQGLKLLGMFGELQPILGHLDQDRLLLGSVGMLSAPNAFFCLPPQVRGIAHVPIPTKHQWDSTPHTINWFPKKECGSGTLPKPDCWPFEGKIGSCPCTVLPRQLRP
jgi:hypothetical protein